MTVYEIGFSGTARVTINDDRVILRVTENRDDADIPEGQPGHNPDHAYRKTLYPSMRVRDDVLQMLVWNAANGSCYANMLDGWADLDREAAYTSIEDVEIDYTDATEETTTDE